MASNSEFQDLHSVAFDTKVILPTLDQTSDMETDSIFDSQGTTQPWDGVWDLEPVVIDPVVIEPAFRPKLFDLEAIFTVFVEVPNMKRVRLLVRPTTTLQEVGDRFADAMKWWNAVLQLGLWGAFLPSTLRLCDFNILAGDVI